MPDYVAPGAPPAGSMCVIPSRLEDLSQALVTASKVAGEASKLPGREATDKHVPGAALINGVIAFEQMLERRLVASYDALRELSTTVNRGLSTVAGQEEENAAAVCQVNGK